MTPDTSGLELPEPSAFYDPATSCWRTSGGMFPSDLMPSLATLPLWGMTRAGALYALPTPELRTSESASSSLLPTPVVNDMGAGKTPEAWDEWTERMKAGHANGNGHGASLSIEALRLLPTPEAKLSDSGPDYARANRIGSGGDDLTTIVHRHLLPTPTTQDASNTGGPSQMERNTLPLNARVTRIGASTPPLSLAGSPSSDDPLPDLLSLLAEAESA